MDSILEDKFKSVFEMALGITEPWELTDMDFRPDEKGKMSMFLEVSFARGSKFADPATGELCDIYDTRERTWRHMNFFQYRCYVTAKVPRITTSTGVKTAEVPWGRTGTGFTLMMEGVLLTLLSKLPVSVVAKQVGEHDTRIWRVLNYYVEEAKRSISLPDVVHIGVDEYSHKGHDYITTFFSKATEKHRKARVIGIEDGKGRDTVTLFEEKFSSYGGKKDEVSCVTSDMCHGYRNAMKKAFRKALITVDKFHVVKMVSDAVDDVRKREHRSKDRRKTDVLGRTRHLFLKNRENLTAEAQARLDDILKMTDLDTVIAYNFRLRLQGLYELNDYMDAADYLENLSLDMCNSSVYEMHSAGKSLARNAVEILNYFETRATNAFLEGFNSVISQIKNAARGFRNLENFKNMIWFRLGDFTFPAVDFLA